MHLSVLVVEAQLQKIKPIDLKPMHKILFNRIGSVSIMFVNVNCDVLFKILPGTWMNLIFLRFILNANNFIRGIHLFALFYLIIILSLINIMCLFNFFKITSSSKRCYVDFVQFWFLVIFFFLHPLWALLPLTPIK